MADHHLHQPSDRSPNQPKELPSDQLEPGKLYAVLCYKGDLATWKWGFYVPDPNESPIGCKGTMFHVVNVGSGSSLVSSLNENENEDGNGEGSDLCDEEEKSSFESTPSSSNNSNNHLTHQHQHHHLHHNHSHNHLHHQHHLHHHHHHHQHHHNHHPQHHWPEWKLEVENMDVVNSPLVVAVIRLADVGFLGSYEELVGKDSLLPIFRTVAIPQTVTKGGFSGGGGNFQSDSNSINTNGQCNGLNPNGQSEGGGGGGVCHVCTTGNGQMMMAEFSSRTWFLDAIFSLHDCGVLQCDDVWFLEREIRRCAFLAMDKYLENKGWTAFKAERCS